MNMKMKILIENLEFYSKIGVYEEERKMEQKVIIDAYIDYAYKEDYLDYAKVAQFIEKFIRGGEFYSIEEALAELSIALKKKYPNILKLKLRLKKPTILPSANVGVEFET